ncbi:FtsQ-type POTRA domain-containing protein [Ammonicoccus fulvus]|uniref:FtsQ-type POTRA domain-containing protein n=1 Tax=Ammonicoccus fulvus TaxID=3138240 RepID=A0ABZ3FQD8_9ACTN
MSTLRDATDRLSRRRKDSRRRRVLRLAIAIGVVLIAGALAWLVFFSSVLAVRTVEVRGTAVLTPEAVSTVAEVPLGRPMARLDERGIAERVTTLPAVDRVNVRRAWPSTVVVTVTERVPVFAIGQGDRATLVDASGAVFVGPRPDGLIEGLGALDDPRTLTAAAAVVAALPIELREQAELVRFTSRDAITIHLRGEREIFFGSAEEAGLKAQVALALVRSTAAKHIDVSAPARPSTR